jgi:hypothetical protein
MEITYSGRYRRRDLLAIDRAAARVLGKGSVLKTTAGFLLATVILILFAVFAASRGSSDGATQWLLVALIPAALSTFNIIAIHRVYSRHPLVGVPIHGVLSESGFALSTPQAETQIAWPAIERTGTSPDYLFLETKGQDLYAFPRTFFSSAQDFASACSIAEQRVSGPSGAPLVRWRRVFALTAILVAITVIALFWPLFWPTS